MADKIFKTEDSLYRFLDTNGDGTGTKQALGDYSSSPTPFTIKPPADQIYRIERMIFHIECGSAQFAVERYGNLAALTNGYLVRVVKDNGATVVKDLTDGIAIKSNGGIGRYCYDVDLKSLGTGDNMVGARWTFSKSGRPLDISGLAGEYLEVIANDNFSTLVDHTWKAQGFIVKDVA